MDKLNSILDTKIQRIETKFDTAIGGLNSQVKTLQTKCVQYEEEIETLKSIVVKQQQTLSRLDMDERNSSVIVSGLSENDIVHGEHTYKSDFEKISALLGEIGLSLPVGVEIQRLGKPSSNPNHSRVIKLKMSNKRERDEILKEKKKLRAAEEPWSRVYLNYDQHPVVVQENNRLRKKMKDLRTLESNNGKELKLKKANL